MESTDFKPHPPEKPKPVDPKGPQELEMPRGKFNFATFTIVLMVVGVLLTAALAFWFYK
ncbi:MAG: hypothetical protein ACREIA_10855 [Opitutaceae bacterium]